MTDQAVFKNWFVAEITIGGIIINIKCRKLIGEFMVLFIFLTSFTMIALGTGSLFLAFFISAFLTCFVGAFAPVVPSVPVVKNQQNATSQNSTLVNSEVDSECEDDDDLVIEMHKRMRCHSHAAIGYGNSFGGL